MQAKKNRPNLRSWSARKSANVIRDRKDRMIAAVTMMPEMQSFQMHAMLSRWRNSCGSSTLVRWIHIRYLSFTSSAPGRLI